MIRGRDSEGRIVLGLTNPEIRGLLEGKVCCFKEGYPDASSGHICIYGGETNADVLARMRKAYDEDHATNAAFAEPLDFRTKPERGDN